MAVVRFSPLSGGHHRCQLPHQQHVLPLLRLLQHHGAQRAGTHALQTLGHLQQHGLRGGGGTGQEGRGE